MFPSYRNQPIDLLSKSTDGFYVVRTLVKGLNLMKRLVEIFAGNNHQNKNDHLIFILKHNNAVKAL